MSVLIAHAGKQHSYHIAKAMDELGVLEQFVTSSYINNVRLQDWLTAHKNQFWTRRFIKGLGGQKVTANWRFEVKEMLYARIFGAGARTQQAVYDRDARFDRYLAKRMHQYKASTYWGFQGSSLLSLESAKRSGKRAVCELATGHLPTAEKLLSEEQQLLPEWADSFDHLTFPEDYNARLMEEPEVADRVVVASAFSKSTLVETGIDPAKVDVLPLGYDDALIRFDPSRFKPFDQRPLKLLYTGRVTQRKGMAYLLDAIQAFSKEAVQLDIIGFIHGSGEGFKRYTERVNLMAPMSQAQLFYKYAEYDALVLPTLFEGFGLVIVEAMAAGLPVITTPHSIGPELIVPDENGYIVPIRSSEAIVSAIQQLLKKSADELQAMRISAHSAAQSYSWSCYSQRLRDHIQSWTAG